MKMKTSLAMCFLTLLSFSTYSLEGASCHDVEEYIDRYQEDTYNLHMFSSSAAELSRLTGREIDFTNYSIGHGTIEKISHDRFRQTTTVEDITTIREFSLVDKKDGCYFEDIHLPQHDKTQKGYAIALYDGGLVLALGSPGEILLQPKR